MATGQYPGASSYYLLNRFSETVFMKRVSALSPELLKKVKVSELTENEMNELRSLVSQFGDVTLLGDRATLHQIYEASAHAKKKTGSVMRKRIAENMEKFVVSAAASRNLYFREYQKETRRESFGKKMQEPEVSTEKKRKKREFGEVTIIKKAG